MKKRMSLRAASAVLIASVPFCWVAANGQQEAISKVPTAQAAEPKTTPYQMETILVAYSQPTEWMFVIGRSGYKSMADLKKGISKLPEGSVLELKTGGKRIKGEPLLSEEEMAALKEFCEGENVKLVLVPGK